MTAGLGLAVLPARVERRFVAGPAPDRPTEELARLRARLSAAVRAGHSRGVSFALRWKSGPVPEFRILVDDPASDRWIARVLLASYGAHAWATVAADAPAAAGRLIGSGRRLALPGENLGWAGDPSHVGPALLAGLASLPNDAALELGVRPVPPARPGLFGTKLPLRGEVSGVRPELGPPRHGLTRARGLGPPTTGETGLPIWSVSIRLEAPIRSALQDLGAIVEGAFRSLDGVGLSCGGDRFGGVWPRRSFLSEAELVGLLPTFECDLLRGEGRVPGRGVPVGRSETGFVVRLPEEPEQGRHVAVVGETGMGKSSLLVALSTRAALRGGLIVLDPLGGTARAVRDELEARGTAVTFVAPGETGVGLNVLDASPGDGPGRPASVDRRVADLVHALRQVRSGRYAEGGFWGPRLEEMLGRSLAAAASLPHGTLEDAHALLAGTSGELRRTPRGTDPLVREVVERVRDRPDDAEGARRLLYEIVHDLTLRAMLCAREPDLRPAGLVRPGRAVVVSGVASAVGGATARYLLSVYLAVVWSELLARRVRSKTFVVLDEAQWFAHESLGEMLRLGRGSNVHTVLATQSLRSLPEDVREAVRTNASDLVAFRGSPDDARDLARSLPRVGEERLLALPRGAALVLRGKGEHVGWVRTARLPSPPPRSVSFEGDGAPARGPESPRPAEEFRGLPGALSELLATLRAEARGLSAGELLRLDVDRRVAVLPPAGAVRALGGWLGRRGALVRTQRTRDGPVWWLDPSRLVPGDGGPNG